MVLISNSYIFLLVMTKNIIKRKMFFVIFLEFFCNNYSKKYNSNDVAKYDVFIRLMF